MFDIHHEVFGQTLLVSVRGELDLDTAPELRALADQALASSGARNLLLDLEDLTFLDSSGLGAILGRYRGVAAAGGRMGIAGARAAVKRVLRLSGVAQIVAFFASRETGLRALARQQRGRPARRAKQRQRSQGGVAVNAS